MMQRKIYFKRGYDEHVMSLPAGKPLDFYQVALNAEFRICSLVEYRRGLRLRKLRGFVPVERKAA